MLRRGHTYIYWNVGMPACLAEQLRCRSPTHVILGERSSTSGRPPWIRGRGPGAGVLEVHVDSTSVVIESQPDWISVGASSPTAFNALLAWSVRHLELERELGNKGKPFHLLGFAGERCGRLAYGVCGRGVVVQLSGDLAHLHLDDLLRRAERLSRIDLAVTVRLDDPDGRTPMEHCLEYQAWTPRGRPPLMVDHLPLGQPRRSRVHSLFHPSPRGSTRSSPKSILTGWLRRRKRTTITRV